jgi:hypothetical protein
LTKERNKRQDRGLETWDKTKKPYQMTVATWKKNLLGGFDKYKPYSTENAARITINEGECKDIWEAEDKFTRKVFTSKNNTPHTNPPTHIHGICTFM